MAGSHMSVGWSGFGARRAVSVLATLCVLVCFSQAQSPEHSASMHGFVRDSQGNPIVGAMVHLLSGSDTPRSTVSDSRGFWGFSGLDAQRTYSLRAEMRGYDKARAGSVVLHASEVRSVDLTLRQSSAVEPGSPSSTL